MYIQTDRHVYDRSYILCPMKPVLYSNEETIKRVGKCLYVYMVQMYIQVPGSRLSLTLKVQK